MRVRFYPLVISLISTNIFTASCEDKGSLTFVIDNTNSMYDDIYQVKQSADAITKIVFEEKASRIKNMVLVTFNDPHARTVIETESRVNFRTHINKVGVYGGGDCPEPSMNGILLGLEKSLPGSFIYVFTDASARDYWKGREIKNLCQKKQTQITFVLTGYCSSPRSADFQIYYDIATACSGIAFYVGKNEVDKVLTTIKETISGNKTAITAIKIPARQYVDIPFVIDDQTEYAIVTASGTDVSLSIRGPRADQTRIMWLNNAKVMKLSDPTPGKYIATVKGSTETSVYIVGRTDFLFSHGFSELEPKTLKDTTPQPIADAKTHLSIMVTDPKHTVNILSAQILDMNERVLQVLPLRRVATDFYTTSLFVAPSHRFKVSVKGKAARNGKDIRRIAKIPVTPQDPPKVIPKSKKPLISISEGKLTEVEYAKSIKLTCKVSAFPEPTITWKNSRGAVLKSQSSAVELPYKYISYLTISDVTKGDIYTCQAGNDQGTEYKAIELVVKDPFDVKSAIEGQTEVQYGRKGTLKCDIRASVPMHIYWSLENEKIGARRQLITSDTYEISADGKELNINKMDLHMVGKYTCKATLDNDSSKFVIFSTQVKIGGLVLPKVTGMCNLIADKGLNVDIQCKVAGEPKPTITWEYMASDASKFVSIRGSANVLRISSVEEKHAGRYKCIAHNVVGNDEHVTTLTVQFSPTITSKQTTYKGLEGDVALRIPCDTTGVPQPVITWKTAGAAITPNARYSVINGALVIKNPKKEDSKSYVCEAKNSLGSAEVTFTAKVDQDLDDYGTVKEVNVLKGTTTKLECGSDDPTQSVRWFMEGNDLKINTKTFNLNNVDVTNEGNYTCRVSDMNGGYTLTYAVVVGFAPEFSFEQEETVFDWNGSEYDMLDCQVESKPPPDVVWTYNGKVISGQQSPVLLLSDDWGHYTCKVSNVHGAVQKSFDVISSNCLIKRKPKNERTMPLILTQESTWPVLDTTKNYLNVAPGQKVIFSCPSQSVKGAKNGLQKFPTKNEITATCDKQDIFIVDGKPYKVSDLHCASEIKSIVHKKHEKCLTETSELMRVGYDVHGFLETYEVCFDTSKNIPLYTRVLMSKSNRGPGITHNWYKYRGIGDGKPKGGYVCADSSSSCCYNKTQLVNARDFSDGPAQKSTYIDPLNAVPYWRPCDEAKDPWDNIESMIRSQLSSYSQFIAWSGTHKLQEKNGLTIPRYLWKVLRFDKDESIAVVYVNDPSPAKEDILCKNICVSDNVPWMRDLDERTYCCELNEFLQAFGLRGTSIGESMDAALGKIKSKKY